MIRCSRVLYWVAASATSWLCSVWLLFRVAPIYDDGYGPSPSFYWGRHAPRSYVELLCPYWIAASVITLSCCVFSPWIVRVWKPRHSYLFLVSSTASMVALILVGAVSDFGVAHNVWIGPTMYAGATHMWPFLKIVVPMSLFAGILAVVRSRLGTRVD